MGVKPAAQQPIAVQREIITGLSRTVPDETPLIDPENSQDEIREIHAVVNAQTADEVNQDPRLINAQQFFHQLSGFKKRSKFLIVLNNIEASGTRKKIAKLINLCMKHGQNLSLFNEDERKIIEAIEKNFGNNFIGTISLLTSTDETLRKLKLKDPLTDQPISSYAKFFDLTKPSLDLFIKQLSSFEQRSNFVNILNNIEDNNVVQEKVVKLINLCTQHGKNLSSLNNKEKEIIEAIEKNFGEDFITIISLLPNSDRTLVKLEPQDPLTNQPFNSYANFCDLTKPSLDLFIKQLSSFEQRFNFLNILNNIEGKGSGVPSKVPKLINLCMKHGQDPFSLNNDEETEIIEAIEENFSKDFISIISLLPNANPTLAKLNLQDPLTKKIIKSYAKFFDLTEPSLDLFINQLSSFEQRSKFLNILNNTEGKSIQEKVAKLINLCEQRGQDLSLLNDEEKKIIEAIEKNFGEDFIGIISLLPSNVRVLAKLNLQDTLTDQAISSYANFLTAEKANTTKEKKASEIEAAQAVKDFILNLDEKLFKLPAQDLIAVLEVLQGDKNNPLNSMSENELQNLTKILREGIIASLEPSDLHERLRRESKVLSEPEVIQELNNDNIDTGRDAIPVVQIPIQEILAPIEALDKVISQSSDLEWSKLRDLLKANAVNSLWMQGLLPILTSKYR